MSTYKVTTLERLYCKDSTSLLATLMDDVRYQNLPYHILFGDDVEFTLENDRFCVIVLKRHGREYKGFVNKYWKV